MASQAGWGWDGALWRYYDGERWTGHTSVTDPTKEPSFERGADAIAEPGSQTVGGTTYEPGWYPDPWAPDSPNRSRYWDGKGWTGYVNDELVAGKASDGAGWGAGAVRIMEGQEQPDTKAHSKGFDPLKHLRLALGFLFLLLVAALLILVTKNLGSDGSTVDAAAEPTSTSEAQAVTTTLPPVSEPDPAEAQSPVVATGQCIETQYTGRVVSAQLRGEPLDYNEVETSLSAGIASDCTAGVHIFWVGEVFNPGFDTPLCYAVLGGGGGKVDADGVFYGSHTVNAGSFRPTPGGEAQTCAALVAEGNVGQYLGQRGKEFAGVVTEDRFEIAEFSTDPDQGAPWIILEIIFEVPPPA